MRWLVLVILAGATAAHAAPWTWHVPTSCPDEHALRDAVARRADVPVHAALVVDSTIEARADKFVARVRIHGPIEDARELTSHSCEELTEAIAVVIARLASMLPPPTSEATAGRPPTPPSLAETSRAALAPQSSSAWNGGLRIAGVLGTGSTPGVGVAGELGGWLQWHRWALAVALTRWNASSAMLDDGMAGIDVGLRTVVVRAGWRPAARSVQAWLVGELGTIRGEGIGLENGQPGSARWSVAGAGIGWSFAVAPRITALAASELEIVLDHAKFIADEGMVLYRTPRYVLRGSVSIEISWR